MKMNMIWFIWFSKTFRVLVLSMKVDLALKGSSKPPSAKCPSKLTLLQLTECANNWLHHKIQVESEHKECASSELPTA